MRLVVIFFGGGRGSFMVKMWYFLEGELFCDEFCDVLWRGGGICDDSFV